MGISITLHDPSEYHCILRYVAGDATATEEIDAITLDDLAEPHVFDLNGHGFRVHVEALGPVERARPIADARRRAETAVAALREQVDRQDIVLRREHSIAGAMFRDALLQETLARAERAEAETMDLRSRIEPARETIAADMRHNIKALSDLSAAQRAQIDDLRNKLTTAHEENDRMRESLHGVDKMAEAIASLVDGVRAEALRGRKIG